MSSVDAFIVVRNHASTLPATLAGLARQTTRPGRVVVVDNGSSDGAAEIVRAGVAGLFIQLVTFGENRGFSAAANEAIRRTDAPWVLALNPDCRLEPDFLDLLIAGVGRRNDVGAACGLLLRGVGADLEPSAVVDSAGMVVHATGRHHDRGAGRQVNNRLLQPAWVFGATGAAALYRRDALKDIAYDGGEVFDETFFAYREDADLAWRLQRRGWKCLYLPQAHGYHARGLKPEARRQGTPEINRHSVRNRFLLRWSNADWRWRLLCFPWWLARDALVIVACLTVERSSLPGLSEAWALRAQQRARGAANRLRAIVSGWRVARWFLAPWRVNVWGP